MITPTIRAGPTSDPGRPDPFDVERLRQHFDFPRELTGAYAELARRKVRDCAPGQSDATRATTQRFERSYDPIAGWLNAPSRRCVVFGRNTTEAQFRDGDNIVSTLLEHNSNFVPWHALSREILPRVGRDLQFRLARTSQAHWSPSSRSRPSRS